MSGATQRPNLAALLLTVLLFALLGFTAWKAWEQALAYDRTTLAIVDALDADNRLEAAADQLLQWLSLGLYEGGAGEVERLNDLKDRQQAYAASVELVTAFFFALVVPALLSAWWVRRDVGDLAYAMLLVAVIALMVGLSAPILSIEASQDLPLLGETVLQFESKGILSTISGLWDSGHLLLALLLFLFSVFIPVMKTLVLGVTFFARTHHLSLRGLEVTRHIGKWSMADVFVVSILVVYFSSNGEGLTDAEVQAGLFFFCGYVVLSLVGSQIIGHLLERQGVTTTARRQE